MTNGENGNNGMNGKDGRDSMSSRPDPTVLTTEQLEREIKHLRELIEARLDQTDRALIEAKSTSDSAVEAARITSQTAVDAAINAAKTAIVEFDSSISRRLQAMADLTDSKFSGVSKEFVTFRTLLDANAAQAALALASADKAVSAAFASSKEAIAKAEVFNEKRFDILTKAIEELKSNAQLMVGAGQGATKLWGLIVGGIGVAIAVVSIILSFNN